MKTSIRVILVEQTQNKYSIQFHNHAVFWTFSFPFGFVVLHSNILLATIRHFTNTFWVLLYTLFILLKYNSKWWARLRKPLVSRTIPYGCDGYVLYVIFNQINFAEEKKHTFFENWGLTWRMTCLHYLDSLLIPFSFERLWRSLRFAAQTSYSLHITFYFFWLLI